MTLWEQSIISINSDQIVTLVNLAGCRLLGRREDEIYNLIDNALRYGSNITTIRFYTLESGDEHIVVCEDNGEGVPAVEKEQIFLRGFGKNTGMGLALSREVLDITAITIIEDGVPGKGARFEIIVPNGKWRSREKGNL